LLYKLSKRLLQLYN